MRRSRLNARSNGRALACKWMSEDLGKPKALIAAFLGVSRPAVTKLVKKGAQVEAEMGVELDSDRA